MIRLGGVPRHGLPDYGAAYLGIPLAPSGATPTYFPNVTDCRAFFNNPARTAKYPVFGWTDLSIEVDKYGFGGGSITFPYSRPWATWSAINSTAGFEYLENSVDVFYRNATTPLFTGVPTKAVRKQLRGQNMITVELETFTSHILRRRLMLTVDNDKEAAALSELPDNLLLRLMRQSFGDLAITPGGYPATRTDYNSWTVTADTSYNNLHPSGITAWETQAGQNLREIAARLCEEYDLFVYYTESSAGVFDFSVDYPYEQNDRSATVALTPLRNTASEYEQTTSYDKVANVWMIGGSGKDTAQNFGFTQDATSVGDLGVFEDRMTSPDASTSMVATDAAYLKSLTANADVTYRIVVQESPTALFNSHYTLRDKVNVHSNAYGNSVQQVIVGYALDIGADGVRIAVDVQDPKRSLLGEIFAKTGGIGGGQSGGGYWNAKDS